MLIDKKTIRYYYWLFIEFVRKHLKLIILSFFISFVFIISFISISPHIESLLISRKEVIGLVGQHDINNLPEEIAFKISNGLIFINEKGEIVPILASTWEVLSSGKEYRFHLRNNLVWNDGRKFTAKDINYSFKDVKIEIIDSNSIYFKFEKPMPIFPNYLRKPIFRYPLVGVAGLYRVERMKMQYGLIKELDLSPNKKGMPAVKYVFFDNENQLVNAYKKGEINQMTTQKKTVAEVFKRWKNTKIEKNIDYSRLMTLFFDLDNPFLKDKEVRQALVTAINKPKFADFGEVAVGPIPPISWAYNSSLKNFPYQSDAAEKIIKKSTEATSEAKLNIATYYDYLDIAGQVSEDLKKAGIEVNLNLISYDKPKNFDLLLAFWKVPFDPDQYFFWHSTQNQGNIGNYKNVKIDKLLEDGRNTLAITERRKIYRDFQKNIQDDPPATFLYFPYVYSIKRK